MVLLLELNKIFFFIVFYLSCNQIHTLNGRITIEVKSFKLKKNNDKNELH